MLTNTLSVQTVAHEIHNELAFGSNLFLTVKQRYLNTLMVIVVTV
jgi:hypothetical protein